MTSHTCILARASPPMRRGSGDIQLIPRASLTIHCMHSCELITNLCAKKVVCHRAEVAKNFRCCNRRLCVLHCDWCGENSLQKAFKVNEAQGISRTPPDPHFSGGVWARDYFPSASEDMYLFGNRMHGVFSSQCIM